MLEIEDKKEGNLHIVTKEAYRQCTHVQVRNNHPLHRHFAHHWTAEVRAYSESCTRTVQVISLSTVYNMSIFYRIVPLYWYNKQCIHKCYDRVYSFTVHISCCQQGDHFSILFFYLSPLFKHYKYETIFILLVHMVTNGI